MSALKVMMRVFEVRRTKCRRCDASAASASALVRKLATEYNIDLDELAPEDLTKCAKWLTVIASYFADLEFA